MAAKSLMVRVRKNARKRTPAERTRFLGAIRGLNRKNGYTVYQQIHKIGMPKAHVGPAFPPWHRAMLLRYERDLQSIDPSVALPSWKFDEPAPDLFTAEYMGANRVDPNNSAPVEVQFALTNPLYGWIMEDVPLRRAPNDRKVAPRLRSDAVALAPDAYSTFRNLAGDPHGAAHMWVGGWMASAPLATRSDLLPAALQRGSAVGSLAAHGQNGRPIRGGRSGV